MKEMNKPVILKNKLFLYLTEFFAGMSVMAVELGASRLLAPYFSSSQIVWTIIIGTIMIAMALGNIYGGRSADKHYFRKQVLSHKGAVDEFFRSTVHNCGISCIRLEASQRA